MLNILLQTLRGTLVPLISLLRKILPLGQVTGDKEAPTFFLTIPSWV